MDSIRFTDEQRALIEANASTYVTACPGAGKTEAIVERFICRASAEQRRGIALLSFTNAAIDAAKSRCIGLSSRLASPNYVGTIDAFINRFIVAPAYGTRKKRPAMFRDTWASVPGTRIAVPGVQGAFELAWFNLSFTDGASLNIDLLPHPQRNSVAKLEPWQMAKLEQEALAAWRRQLEHGVFDAATARQVMNCYLGESELREQLKDLVSARFAEVVVDEAQDCSREDVQLLEFLESAGIRLVLVGDPDQGIYGFRGGSAAELTTLLARLQEGRRLDGNFRSSPAICSIVDSLRTTCERDVPRGRYSCLQEPIHIFPYRQTKHVADRAVGVLESCGLAVQDAVVLAHATAKARACSGAGAEPSPGGNRLVRLALAVHVVGDEHATSAARARALDQVGRILRELGFDDDKDLSHEDFLAKYYLTSRSYRYACLQLAMGLGHPYEVTPKQFRDKLVAQEKSQTKLAWSTKALRTPSGNKWSAVPKPRVNRLPHSTIHGYKGLQAPAVVLVIPEAGGSDDGATAWIDGVSNDSRRVLYVGASRAQRLLVLAVHESMFDGVSGVLARDGVPFVIDQF